MRLTAQDFEAAALELVGYLSNVLKNGRCDGAVAAVTAELKYIARLLRGRACRHVVRAAFVARGGCFQLR